MNWTEEHIERVRHLFPKPRGTVEIDHLTFLQALQYMAENGCRWRGLPEIYGKWGTIYQRFRRWIALGIFDRIEKELQSQTVTIKGIKALAFDSTYVKVHPDGTGTPKKGYQSIGKSRAGLTTKIHAVVADVGLPIARRLSPGSAADDPEGQKLMPEISREICEDKSLTMDKAYEGDACRAKVEECGMRPVVPPKSNRLQPWEYDKELYKSRNVVERYFRNIKQFRRVFTRYDKLDETYNTFIAIANISYFMKY
jgi:transposase